MHAGCTIAVEPIFLTNGVDSRHPLVWINLGGRARREHHHTAGRPQSAHGSDERTERTLRRSCAASGMANRGGFPRMRSWLSTQPDELRRHGTRRQAASDFRETSQRVVTAGMRGSSPPQAPGAYNRLQTCRQEGSALKGLTKAWLSYRRRTSPRGGNPIELQSEPYPIEAPHLSGSSKTRSIS
jgi:hypothetical protein